MKRHAPDGFGAPLDETLQHQKTRGVMLPGTDKAALIRVIAWEEDVTKARQPPVPTLMLPKPNYFKNL